MFLYKEHVRLPLLYGFFAGDIFVLVVLSAILFYRGEGVSSIRWSQMISPGSILTYIGCGLVGSGIFGSFRVNGKFFKIGGILLTCLPVFWLIWVLLMQGWD